MEGLGQNFDSVISLCLQGDLRGVRLQDALESDFSLKCNLSADDTPLWGFPAASFDVMLMVSRRV